MQAKRKTFIQKTCTTLHFVGNYNKLYDWAIEPLQTAHSGWVTVMVRQKKKNLFIKTSYLGAK